MQGLEIRELILVIGTGICYTQFNCEWNVYRKGEGYGNKKRRIWNNAEQ